MLKTMRRWQGTTAMLSSWTSGFPLGLPGRGDGIERVMYGFSLFICRPGGISHAESAATGTVMRLDTLRQYAREAGFSAIEILAIEADFWRFYRLVG